METIAVYWESVIRTYGFNLMQGQILGQMTLPFDRLNAWSRALQGVDEKDAAFRLVWSYVEDGVGVKFFLLCDDIHWHRLQLFWDTLIQANVDIGLQAKTSVDVIFFQGPHFGDRYGIMDYTFKALAPGQVPLLAVTCSAATIYLVVPAGWGKRTKALLTEAFEIPKQAKQKAERDSDSGAHR
jgi:hypothetical protein